MLIFLTLAFVGALCILAGLMGLREGSPPSEALLNLGLGLATVLGVGYAFFGTRRPR